MKRFLTILGVFALMAGCSKPEAAPDLSVKGVYLNVNSLKLSKGETATLTATVNPADAENPAVSWSSSDASVASVDNNGKVTALKDGTAKITVTTADGGKTASCDVTVTDPSILKGISLDNKSISLGVTGTQKLEVTYQPESAANKKVSWTSSDASIASVSSDGLVTGLQVGSATITATSEDGGYTATCKVTVKGTELYWIADYPYVNGKKYTNPTYSDGVHQWFYSDGNHLYEGIATAEPGKEGIYRDGSLWVAMELPSGIDLKGISGTKLYFWDIPTYFKVYDYAKKSWVFDKEVTTRPDYHFNDFALAPDGTAYIVGRYSDKSHNNGGYVSAVWTISSDLQTVTETLLKQDKNPNDYTAFSVDLDSNGNVWVLSYLSTAFGSGGLKLYKNGKYQRTVYTDNNANDCHYIRFYGNDYYIVSTAGASGNSIRVFKNTSSLYTISHPHFLSVNCLYISMQGEMYFTAHCFNENQRYIYKDNNVIYTIDNGLYSFAVVY